MFSSNCLQVEHGITEMVTGVDLVNWQLQLQVPGMSPPDLTKSAYEANGWAIEARINAETPLRNFAPSSGTLGQAAWPPGESALRRLLDQCGHPFHCTSNASISARHAKIVMLA